MLGSPDSLKEEGPLREIVQVTLYPVQMVPMLQCLTFLGCPWEDVGEEDDICDENPPKCW